ncbi:S-layer homology domain-containing protein [Mammaliicoccus sciuri]
MANQPTKYRKFVVGAASAALVASAVAPVAFAADFSDTKGNTHEEAINALSEAGVIKGYEDGTFKPNKTLTRSDVVKLMGKWLVSEGYKVPADAQSKPRFADLKSTSNKELLEMAAVVYDNGVFVGTPDGKLDPTGDITRENMAIVLVRAFDRVHDIDLASYVADQDFKKDVTDLGKAKAEARPAIDVLDFFDITNPAAPEFNPKATTTRGHFATFLHKTINADFSDVEGGVVAPGVASVKAVNATTVEVAMKDKVENINSLNFKIDGLTVSNAAVKQTDDKVVVLTTAVQKGGEKYTVTLNDKAIGSFTGISAVVPEKIKITTQSVQGKVGAQAIISADVGVKQAGIPVTFSVKPQENVTLNKDQIFEGVTNADGIATFSYTQYENGTDQVVAYPTGAPTVRSLAYVFWGVDSILTIESQDKKGNTVNNGEDKTYKVTYLNPKTGKPVANAALNVSFLENIDVNINETSKATVNGTNPRQLLNNETPIAERIVTDSKGEAVFTVSGQNTSVTPVVFARTNESTKYEASKLQATAEKVTFAAVQSDYTIDVVRDGAEEAAVGVANGRGYKLTVKTKDGKVAANEVINVAFNEDIDRVISTETEAYFVKEDPATGIQVKNTDAVANAKRITVKTDAKGEAKFIVGSENDKDYATPVAWIDINSADATDGKLDEGETYKVAPITYFAQPKLTGSKLEVRDSATIGGGTKKDKYAGTEKAYLQFQPANQSGKTMALATGYDGVKKSYTIFNDGPDTVTVHYGAASTQDIVSGRSYTVDVAATDTNPVYVDTANKSAKVRVSVSGTATPTAGTTNLPVNLGTQTAEFTFQSTSQVGDLHTGTVGSIDPVKEEIVFSGKDKISYKDATTFMYNGSAIGKQYFEQLVALNAGTIVVTAEKDKATDKFAKFTINSGVNIVAQANVNALSTAATGVKKAGETVDIKVTFSEAVTVTGAPTLTLNAGATTASYTSGTGTNELTFTYTVGAADVTPTGTTLTVSAVNLPGGATIKTTNGGQNANLATAALPKSFAGLTVDAVAPVGTLPATTGTTNNATTLVATFSEALYDGSTAIANGADVKSLFTYDGTAANYTSATYNATDKTVTFVFTAAEDTKKLTSAATLKDAAGNALATENYTYANTGTIWTK